MPFLRGRRDSDSREKAEAYGAEEAGRQSGKKKTEYEGAGACKGNARLSEVAASGGEVSNFEIVYICRKWHGEPKSQDGEMEDLRFLSVSEIVLSEISPPIRSVVEKYISQAHV